MFLSFFIVDSIAFASTNEEDPGLFKIKIKRNKDGDLVKAKDKVANNSEHVFIDNENIIDKISLQIFINFIIC